jgi:hypothetical protein
MAQELFLDSELEDELPSHDSDQDETRPGNGQWTQSRLVHL